MNYTDKFHQLKTLFNPGGLKTEFPDSDIVCHWAKFDSKNISDLAEERDHFFHKNGILSALPDEAIAENRSFTYPVFKTSGASKNRQAILLLHGLNERSWVKYLVWAYYLALNTGRPVILFPIAFHMNRSPEAWGDPRVMSSLLASRKQQLGNVPMSTFANVALSERLCEDPLRFLTSGQQSAADLVQLTRELKSGTHPLFDQETSVDIFAYSIGAFLAQILFIGNPEGLYNDSRLFLFCGGALFDRMDGVSKLIMDQKAFERLRQFYIHELNQEKEKSEVLAASLDQTELGQSFLSMLSIGNLRSFRENVFQRLHKQVRTIALLRDKVIPAEGILESLNRFIHVDILDFQHDYSHENPFPILNGNASAAVDRSFESVFSRIASFLR